MIVGSRIPIGPGIEEGEPCLCQGAPRAVSSGRVDFEIRAPQIAANAVLKYYWKFRFGRNARFLYLQKSGGPRSGADPGFQPFGNPANSGNFCAASNSPHRRIAQFLPMPF